MKLLPRRNADAATAPSEPVDLAKPAKPGGKGRPTPKRRDVVGQRGPVTAPKTRKEALARQREQAKLARSARSKAGAELATTPAERRAALKAGDPRYLPRRDQGPTRKLARDYVDSHRMFSNYLLWLFPLMIVSYAIPIVQIVVILTFFALLGEWIAVGRRIRAMAIQRFGKADGSALSIGFYAGSRAYLPRRWRLPAPQVERGDAI